MVQPTDAQVTGKYRRVTQDVAALNGGVAAASVGGPKGPLTEALSGCLATAGRWADLTPSSGPPDRPLSPVSWHAFAVLRPTLLPLASADRSRSPARGQSL